MEKLVSVVLCAYNGAPYISEQLDSILSQTYANIEVIVIDDCSSDNTVAILEEYSRLGKIKLYLNSENKGVNWNFYYGLSLASGCYIAPSDQDDIWLPTKIEMLVNNIGGSTLIYCDSYISDSYAKKFYDLVSERSHFLEGNDVLNILMLNCVAGHAMLFDRRLLDFFETPSRGNGIYYDHWLTFMAMCIGSIAYIKEPLVIFRRHQTAVTVKEAIESKIKSQIGKNTNLLSRLEAFRDYPYLNDKDSRIINEIIDGAKGRVGNIFSIGLFILFLRYNRRVWKGRNKSVWSNIFHSFKESIGIVRT